MKNFTIFNKDFSAVIGLVVGLFISLLLVVFFKENPLHVLKVLLSSFMQSRFDFGLTLFYTTCFIFSGLAFAIPFRAGLFHIGAEGQIIFSALIAAIVGIEMQPLAQQNAFVLPMLVIVLCALFAGIMASLSIAIIKVFRQGHEVVVAIMMNFILSALATYIALRFYQNPDSQNPETALLPAELQYFKHDLLKHFFEDSPVSLFFMIAVFSCLAMWFFEERTRWGYMIRAYGENKYAAIRMGISEWQVQFIVMGLAGLFSACVGLTEVLGSTFQFKIGFSPAYGFLGIVVALLARDKTWAMIFSSFVMAVLHKGASDLDLETQFITRDFSKVMQAIIIMSVSGAVLLQHYFLRNKKGDRHVY